MTADLMAAFMPAGFTPVALITADFTAAQFWFAAAVAGPQILGAGLYRATRSRAERRALAPVSVVAAALVVVLAALGTPAPLLVAPAATALSGAFVVAGSMPRPMGAGAGWGAAMLGLLALAWTAVLIAPAVRSAGGAELGMPLAALLGGAALAAHWPRLAAVYADPAREPPLPWFLWSASNGGWAVMVMVAGEPWPFLAFPLVAQAATLGIGIFALEGGPERRERGDAAR